MVRMNQSYKQSVRLKVTASSIINEFYHRPKDQTAEDSTVQLIKTAARLIKNNIQTMDTDKSIYPAPSMMSSVNGNKLCIS